MGHASLGGTERSAHFEVVVDIAVLASRVEGHVGAGAVRTLHLDVDVRKVVHAERLTLGSIELSISFADSLREALTFLFVASGGCCVMKILQELVVFVVGGQLKRVLVVCKQSVVSVGKISKSASLKVDESELAKACHKVKC